MQGLERKDRIRLCLRASEIINYQKAAIFGKAFSGRPFKRPKIDNMFLK
jgi:hypothetical protein